MSNFTPQEIEEFLQEFFDVVGARQYVGARYVPIFGRAGEDSIEWDDLAPYEPLTVVMHDGVSYVSRRYVPAGIEITETDYWVETYRFNAQVEQYRQEVLSFQGQIDNRIPFPDPDFFPRYGVLGQVLSTLADGTVKWQDPVVPSDEQAEEVITAWLDDHPEATTTVQDGSLTKAKFGPALDRDVMFDRYVFAGTDVDDIADNGFYFVSEGTTNLPTATGTYLVQTILYNASATAAMQLAYTYNTGLMWYRKKTSGTWGPWSKLVNESDYVIDRYTFSGTDVNDIATNSFYYVDAGTTNLPTSDNAYFIETILYNASGTALMQLAYNFSSGRAYHRRYSAASWSNWHLINEMDTSIFLTNKYAFAGTDVNDIATNSFYYVDAGTTNLPTSYNAYFIETILYNASGTALMQLAYNFSSGRAYHRRYSAASWSNWHLINEMDTSIFLTNKYAFAGTDVNDINENTVYFCAEGKTNLPTATGGYFVQTILYNATGQAAFQLAYKFDDGAMYYRRKVSGTWQTWINQTRSSSPSRKRYYAYGDSLMYGAVWERTESSPYYQVVRASTENRIPTRIASATGLMNFNNYAVGGAYFVGSGTNTIYSQIANATMTNVGLITVAGGRNDSENTLGDKNSTVDDGTICGAIKKIIEYLLTNYPKAQIVWIGVTPNTSDNSTVFTRIFAGGWSLNTFDEKVSELCAEYHIPYVNWKDCTYMNHWADFSGAGSVYSHPDNEESYMQMGNYIAGRVTQYYVG